MSQQQLAEAAGVSIALVRKLEYDDRPWNRTAGTAPDFWKLASIAQVLDLDLQALAAKGSQGTPIRPHGRKAPSSQVSFVRVVFLAGENPPEGIGGKTMTISGQVLGRRTRKGQVVVSLAPAAYGLAGKEE